MPWLSEHEPFEQQRSDAQVAAVIRLLGDAPRRILDLGCGSGRVLVPIASAGHVAFGIDEDPQAIQASAEHAKSKGVGIQTHIGNFLDASAFDVIQPPFDAIICLGNTFMTIPDIDVASAMATRIHDYLRPGGLFMIDDIAGDFWPEVAEGYWQNGITDDSEMQMVWAEDDSVFAIRTGDAVDDQVHSLQPADRLFRLWLLGDLQLLAKSAGLSAPEVMRECGLIVFRRN